ncbi:hypothetical protein BV394_00765 [Brevirhabdus pacifica]|uniref:Uncharacterized protein n=1 Tax=Brevirhabdus pacifica TaxID=1267768 RepID=A0A1U7DEP1_9RHOB|nr:chaperone modulator CbpM [Brevirhabdus pacifica]APX88442.1 hypothetical protein BV394_00765 [Brevirhabdus pacifica]OWU79750.1 hypothetical protein ATO5_01460 [Loktanella sp. 22II-4b]PJJ87093.1 chaperone modulatory protein CbpM [Brevirhabdus pacifica]
MTERFSEDEALAAVARLDRRRLHSYLEARIVTPVQTEGGQVFRRIDLVRMELLCELEEDFGLNEDALAMVISLIDQLHEARGDLNCVLEALQDEPRELQAKVGAALSRLRAER